MNDMFGIRNTATGEVIRTYDNPIEAKKAVLAMQPTGYSDFEVVEKGLPEYEFKRLPDGRSFIVGTKVVWNSYPI